MTKWIPKYTETRMKTAKIVQDYLKHKDTKIVAGMNGVSRGHVSRCLKSMGIPLYPRNRDNHGRFK